MSRPSCAVSAGLDVGAQEHHSSGLSPDEDRLPDGLLPQGRGRGPRRW
ncbi:MAG: hypothetical protein ABI206_15880 [Antricoccus sp.]